MLPKQKQYILKRKTELKLKYDHFIQKRWVEERLAITYLKNI